MTITSDFLRTGSMDLATYLGDPQGSTIEAPGDFSIEAIEYTYAEVKVKSGPFFNQGSLNGLERTARPFFLALNGDGDLIPLVGTIEKTFTPGASDNSALGTLTVPAGVLYAGFLIDNKIAQLIPSQPDVRRVNIARQMTIPIFYEPVLISMTKALLDQNALGQTARIAQRLQLPNTTGEANHGINFTKIDVPINNSVNAMITTRSSQKFEGTFVAPRSEFLALQTAGTRFDGCGCAPALTQVGFRGGSCDAKRVFEVSLPGDNCQGLIDGLIYAQAVFGEADLSIAYSSEAVANLPFSIMEASSQYFNGVHSVSFVDFN